MSGKKRISSGAHDARYKRQRNVSNVSEFVDYHTKRTNADRMKLEQQDAINKAKARLSRKLQVSAGSGTVLSSQESQSTRTEQTDKHPQFYDEDDENEGKGGLQVEIHPLLRNIIPQPKEQVYRNPLKLGTRKWFDPAAINPYLNQSDVALKGKTRRLLHFNEKGKYISKANELREKAKLDLEEEEGRKKREQLGLSADEAIGEHMYKKPMPPYVEWWDQPYLLDHSYDHIDDISRLNFENESAPISIYIQHPVPINPPWEKHLPPPKPMYLTKKELKRIRRNDRLEKNKEKQDRIKLGLDPAPPPKVKLSNLMSVMTNEAIKDPTLIEMKVRKEVEQRKKQHMAENESRKLSKEERHAKVEVQYEKNLEKGYHTCVFKVLKLVNGKHKYKINVNAQQLKLNGVTVLNSRFSLVVVEGALKSINSFKNLMLRRIDWKENAPPKSKTDSCDSLDNLDDLELEDLSQNKCTLLWEGQLKDLNFKKWSISESESDEQALEILSKYGAAHYWREAIVAEK